MYKLLMACCTIGLLGLSANIQASNWEYIDRNNSIKAYIDTDSLKRYGSEVTAWGKYILNKPEKASNGKLYSIAKHQTKYNCRDGYSTILYIVLTTKNGTVVNSFSIPSYYQEREPVVPDTIGESAYNFVCSYGQ